MQPDWPKIIGELLADHELADRKRVDEMTARIAALEARPVDKGAAGEPGPPGPQGQTGERGESGRDGRDASDLTLLRNLIDGQVTAAIAEIVRMASVTSPDGGRTLNVKLGDTTHEIRTAIPLDAGAWTQREYAAGDGVSLDGSFWIARTQTSSKPPSDDWRLAVRSGRNGKDFRPDDPPPAKPVRFK